MTGFPWRRRLIFIPTLVVLVTGLGAGIVASLRFESRLPRIELDYGWYLSELRARGDHAGFVHGLEVALAIDDGLDPAGGEKLLGSAYSDEQRFVEATQHYRRATELDPNDAESQLLLGSSLLQLNRASEAIAPLSRARDLLPEVPEVRLNLGLALARTDRLDEAIAEFETLVQLQPQVARYHGVLAMTLHGAGRVDQARQHCQEALRLEPGNPQLQRQCDQISKR